MPREQQTRRVLVSAAPSATKKIGAKCAANILKLVLSRLGSAVPTPPKSALGGRRPGLSSRLDCSKLTVEGPPKDARIISLEGDLGSGKTTFVQGFARGLGIKRRMTSPTFVIARKYAIRAPHLAFLFHIDAYRIRKPGELLALGFKNLLRDPKNIILIEWGNKISRLLPKHATRIVFSHGKNKNERRIVVSMRKAI